MYWDCSFIAHLESILSFCGLSQLTLLNKTLEQGNSGIFS